MSKIFTRRASGVVFAALLIGGVSWAVIANARPQAREITLIARGMYFYNAAETERNPTLSATRGERIRLILVNQEAGLEHDVAVPELGVSSDAISEAGATTSVSFQTPSRPGRYDYVCTFHDAMMRGLLIVD